MQHTRRAEHTLLRRTGARAISPAAEPELHALTERLALLAGLPVPELRVIDSDAANAFAVGLTASRSVVVVTTGLRGLLEPDELEAVVAHEVAHIANRDGAVMTFAGVPRTIGLQLGTGAGLPIWFLLWPAGVPLILLGSLLLLTLSRTREFAADRGSALLTGSPEHLMSALLRLEDARAGIPEGDLRRLSPVAALCVVPLRRHRLGLLADHPQLPERLERLAELGRRAGEPARS